MRAIAACVTAIFPIDFTIPGIIPPWGRPCNECDVLPMCLSPLYLLIISSLRAIKAGERRFGETSRLSLIF